MGEVDTVQLAREPCLRLRATAFPSLPRVFCSRPFLKLTQLPSSPLCPPLHFTHCPALFTGWFTNDPNDGSNSRVTDSNSNAS